MGYLLWTNLRTTDYSRLKSTPPHQYCTSVCDYRICIVSQDGGISNPLTCRHWNNYPYTLLPSAIQYTSHDLSLSLSPWRSWSPMVLILESYRFLRTQRWNGTFFIRKLKAFVGLLSLEESAALSKFPLRLLTSSKPHMSKYLASPAGGGGGVVGGKLNRLWHFRKRGNFHTKRRTDRKPLKKWLV